jgi:archaemetzincin
MRRVTIIPLGWMDEKTILAIKNFISVITDMDVVIGSNLDIPRYAYNQRRDQYRVQTILENLSFKHSGGDFIIGISDVDLYRDGYNFVFGHSNLINGVSMISILRLKEEYYGRDEDPNLFRKRVLTEAIHEIGHLLGLFHCKDIKCVMHDPLSIEDIDRKEYEFCTKCSKSLDNSSFKKL